MVVESTSRKTNRVEIGGKTIFNIDLSCGWCISQVEFDGTMPINNIDWIKISLIKQEDKQYENMP